MKLLRAVLLFAISVITVSSRAATFTVTTNAGSGAGSLWQALTDANATLGLDTIVFAIGSGAQTIVVAYPYYLPAIEDPVVIDGTTQPGDAREPLIRLYTTASQPLRLRAGSSTVRGLAFDGLQLILEAKDGNAIRGNYFARSYGVRIEAGSNANTIGGPGAGDGNTFGTYLHVGSSHNTIQGNTWSGGGIGVGGSDNQIGGSAPGAGNRLSYAPIGIWFYGSGNRVEGNTLTNDGYSYYYGSSAVYVGGPGNTIGGLDPGAGNTIVHNYGGVEIANGGNAVLSNSIYDNYKFAIDIQVPDAARVQICEVVSTTGGTRVSGWVVGKPSDTYLIQLFGNPSKCDGQTYLGSGSTATDGSGRSEWQITVAAAAGSVISATATDSGNTTSPLAVCTTTCRRIPTDFNGDGYSDVFWRNTLTGQNAIWFLKNRSIIGGLNLPDVGPSYSPYLADFDGDASTDLYWWNPAARDAGLWLIKGSSLRGAGDGYNRSTKGEGWDLLVGDFSGDGRGDLFWRELATGRQEIWTGLPFTFAGRTPSVALAPGWERRAAHVGGGPGEDVMWRFAADGSGSFWFMNGPAVEGGTNLWPVGSDWTPSLWDVTGDDRADLLWRHNTTGELTFWFLDGGRLAGGGGLSFNVPPPWLLFRGDFNGDGRIDVLWRNPVSGENTIWFLDGRRIIGGGNLPFVSPVGWTIVGAQ